MWRETRRSSLSHFSLLIYFMLHFCSSCYLAENSFDNHTVLYGRRQTLFSQSRSWILRKELWLANFVPAILLSPRKSNRLWPSWSGDWGGRVIQIGSLVLPPWEQDGRHARESSLVSSSDRPPVGLSHGLPTSQGLALLSTCFQMKAQKNLTK